MQDVEQAAEAGPVAGLLGSRASPTTTRGRRGGRAARLRLGLDRRVMGFGRADPAGLAGALTPRSLRLGTALMQLSARTPDRCRDGRADHGPALRRPLRHGPRGLRPAGRRGLVRRALRPSRWPAPASTSRSCATCMAREEPVTNAGPHYPLPYPGGTGLGKPLKPITHPLRADLPIILGAEGPKNIALAAEIADGWLPIFYAPEHAGDVPRVARTRASPVRARRTASTTSRCWPAPRSSSPTTSRPPPT